MKHNIEGDIRNCIEVANYDYSLSHLDEPMLNYYNELVAKAKAFDEILNIEDNYFDKYDEPITAEEFLCEFDFILDSHERNESADDER